MLKLQKRIRLAAAIITLLGLGSAFLLYLHAANASDDLQNDDIGVSRIYSRNLRLYGGEMAVMEDQFCRWFNGFWQGKSLAYTVAGITILIACGCLLAAENVHLSDKK